MAELNDEYGYEADLEQGVVATGLLGAMSEILEEQRQLILRKMVNRYRSGNTEHDVLVGLVAELKALDDFIVNCEAMQTRGNVAAERMHRNAPQRR